MADIESTGGIISYLVENNLMGPLAQLAAAIVAVSGVLITQLFLHRRSERDIAARFEEQKKQHEKERADDTRKEKLEKAEQVFELLLDVRNTFIDVNQKIKELGECTIEMREYIEGLEIISEAETSSIEARMRITMLCRMYLPECEKSLVRYLIADSDFADELWHIQNPDDEIVDNQKASMQLRKKHCQLMLALNNFHEELSKLPQKTAH
ncbi:hypothetical protein C9J01_27685 [Photobacterium rosenbergii]|uniref:Uncharacterized protein n=1 Tax=Photobacterium rosenbergii TaxID=294936 RepID=A0A2T3MYI4_9GAMM|nr:hypothetical protein [Photobacterium rosenbergii]PSW05050.1 hypothetical protein C9J01_27685 [Photobacterium rosenbergii]